MMENTALLGKGKVYGLVSYKIRGFVAEKVLQLHFSNRLASPSLLVGAWVHFNENKLDFRFSSIHTFDEL